MSPRTRDLTIGIGTAAFFAAVLFLIIPYQIRVPPRIAVLALSPAFWPTTVTILGILVGAVITLRALLGQSTEDDDADTLAAGETREEWRGIAAIAGMFAYLGLVHVIGIMAASIIAIPALAWLFGEYRLRIVAPVAIAVPVLMYYFFTTVVRLPLPLGVFERFL